MIHKVAMVVVFSVLTNTVVSQVIENSWDTRKLVDQIEIFAGPGLLYPKPAYDFGASNDRLIKIGYSVGVGVTFGIGPKFGVESDIAYDRRGIKNSNNLSNDVLATVNVSNDYVTLSVLPSMVVGPARRFTFGVGPYFAHLTSSKATLSYDSINGTHSSFNAQTSDYYRQFDLGLVLSVKYSFFIHRRVFIIRIINSSGLIYVDQTPIPSLISISRNNSLALLIGMRL